MKFNYRTCECAECHRTRTWEVQHTLRTLTRNLAIGAALCRAHEIGLYEAEDHRLYHEHGYRLGGCWSPGCGRPAP